MSYRLSSIAWRTLLLIFLAVCLLMPWPDLARAVDSQPNCDISSASWRAGERQLVGGFELQTYYVEGAADWFQRAALVPCAQQGYLCILVDEYFNDWGVPTLNFFHVGANGLASAGSYKSAPDYFAGDSIWPNGLLWPDGRAVCQKKKRVGEAQQDLHEYALLDLTSDSPTPLMSFFYRDNSYGSRPICCADGKLSTLHIRDIGDSNDRRALDMHVCPNGAEGYANELPDARRTGETWLNGVLVPAMLDFEGQFLAYDSQLVRMEPLSSANYAGTPAFDACFMDFWLLSGFIAGWTEGGLQLMAPGGESVVLKAREPSYADGSLDNCGNLTLEDAARFAALWDQAVAAEAQRGMTAEPAELTYGVDLTCLSPDKLAVFDEAYQRITIISRQP